MSKRKPTREEEEVFKENEIVLGFHGPLLYPAKIIQVDNKDKKKLLYFVHYQGWSKKWDEWVDSSRLMKETEANRKYAEELKEQVKNKKGTKRKGDSSAKKGVTTARKKLKKEEDDTVESDDARQDQKEVKIKIPPNLKRLLITDWENITRHQKLVPLPRSPTVNVILEEFLKAKKK